MRLRARIVVDERSPELEKINNYICIMYAKKKYKPMYGNGGMTKLTQYMNGGRIYAENGDQVPEASADPLKSPAVQAAIEKLLSPYRDQIDYMRQQRSKYGSNDPAVGGLRSQTRSAYAALEGAGEGDVDVLRSLISMEPTNREEAAQKAKAIEFAQSVSDEYAREMGTPLRNPLYNFFGLEGGPKYGNGGTVKYRSGGKFPDLTGDGKVTMADILKGRGVGK